jgi:hypothetical protein
VFSPAFYALYIASGVSDMIDGTVARKTGTASEFGSLKLARTINRVFLIRFNVFLLYFDVKKCKFYKLKVRIKNAKNHFLGFIDAFFTDIVLFSVLANAEE